MDQSVDLLSAQVHFLDTELALIHIPLPLYHFFIQPILRLLLPAYSNQENILSEPSTGTDHARTRPLWAYDHPFVNISLTPVECSVVCPRKTADELFAPIVESLGSITEGSVVISKEDYVVIQVDGEGLEAGQRVVELTSPLAMNGISIFFITTYFSDYILVPIRLRATVISALEDRGFIFEENSEAFVNVSSPLMTSSFHMHSRETSGSAISPVSSNPFEESFMPASTDNRNRGPTPPPSSLPELESRTFALLANREIHPTVDPSIQLIQCAGRKDTSMRLGREASTKLPKSPSSLTKQLHLGLVRCLACTPRPRFFSVTLTDTEPASLLMERRLLIEFEDLNAEGGEEILLGSKEDVLIPITLDLRELPMESTGIICGVAGRLSGCNGANTSIETREETNVHDVSASGILGPVEMSYLSTARAGTVIIAETDLDRAMGVLKV